jgi:hypothetical protein
MAQTKIGGISTTIRLNREARQFLEKVAPGKSKGCYLTALLLQERTRLEERQRFHRQVEVNPRNE